MIEIIHETRMRSTKSCAHSFLRFCPNKYETRDATQADKYNPNELLIFSRSETTPVAVNPSAPIVCEI